MNVPSEETPHATDLVLRGAFLCEDMRIEDSGKRILLGVYSRSIISTQRPSILSLQIVGAFDLRLPGRHHVEYRVRAPGIIGKGAFESTADNPGDAYAEFTAPIHFLADEPGEILFDWRLNKGPWRPPIRWSFEFDEEAENLPKEEADRMRSALSLLRLANSAQPEEAADT